jgi:large subunit ribosomal protein L27Ae
MRYFHKQPNHFWKPVINLDKVHKILPPHQDRCGGTARTLD